MNKHNTNWTHFLIGPLMGVVCLIAGCQAPPAGPVIGDGSNTPNLSLTPDNHVLLSWTEPTQDGHALKFSAWDGRDWQTPGTIAAGPDWFVNWADFPSVIVLPNGDLAAHWLQREGPDTYAYGVRIVRSSDSGATWSEPVTPHRDGTLTEHGFVTLYPVGQSSVGAVWLDGRQMVDEGGAMSLRSAVLDRDGTLTEEALLDGRTCDCCQTAVAVTGTGPVVVYRDRDADEIRDISVVRYANDQWSTPVPVHADRWLMPACPVNGPVITNTATGLLAAWFTAADNESRVNVAWSHDDGKTFEQPVHVDGGRPLGRVGTTALDDGDVLVSWLEETDTAAAIMLRRVRADGGLSDVSVITAVDPGRASGFPRIAVRDATVLVAWTDTTPPGRVRVTTTPVPP